MLLATLDWREEFKPHAITWEDIAGESATGKVFRMDVPDLGGRPILILRAANENTPESEMQIRNLVYHLEHSSFVADETGDGYVSLIVDQTGFSIRKAPGLKHSLKILHIMQNHYPERLHVSLIYNAPTLFSTSWRLISPFIDAVTKSKVEFVHPKTKGSADRLAARFDMSQMEEQLLGTRPASSPAFELASYGERSSKEDARMRLETPESDRPHPASDT